MRIFAAITLAGRCCCPGWRTGRAGLAVAFVWGAGGCLYTLAMIDIGFARARHHAGQQHGGAGDASHAGRRAGAALGGAALQWSPRLGFPALLLAVAATGLAMLLRARIGQRM